MKVIFDENEDLSLYNNDDKNFDYYSVPDINQMNIVRYWKTAPSDNTNKILWYLGFFDEESGKFVKDCAGYKNAGEIIFILD